MDAMTETLKLPAGKDPKRIAEARSALKKVNPAKVRKEIKKLIASEAFGMVLTTIEEVHKGHHAALKHLLELGAMDAEPVRGDLEENLDLAKTLLKRWGLEDSPGSLEETASSLHTVE